MPTQEKVKQDILDIVRAGVPEEYKRKKEHDPEWLAGWSEAASGLAMAEI